MSKLLVGAHCVVWINGRRVDEIESVRYDSNTPHIERAGIDSLMAYSIDPQAARITGTISVLRLQGTGGLQGRGIVAPFEHLAMEKFFSILMVSRVTGKKLFQADFCKCTGESWNFAARQRVQGQFSFTGIEWSNEAEYG